ncbi:MAG: DUF2339 domain-containing protein [Candidatus Hydrogenedentes bacterium]|nr:DUF2339 domain-containing protein [Candidatus Hydrogenedentota bacterium]
MSSEETLRRLRKDLDKVIARTEEISRRLKEMDELDGAAARVCEEVAPAADSQGEVPPLEQETPPAEPVRIMPLPFPAQPAEAPDRGAVPENSLWRTIAGHPAGRFLRGRAEEIRQRTRELGWEVLLGTYMLPRVAVACIAIAVVFFLTLAIERWGAHWMPHLRVGIGYAVSAGLLWLGWRSEKKFAGLARVLYGGGFAVMYFVTFATHYVRYAQVFQSAVPTLLLLVALVATWAVVAQIRQSKIIAALVTGLGHLTVLLSVLTLAPPGPFPILGIVVLSAGSAFFLLRNHWYHVAALGLAGSYLNDFVALGHGRTGDPKLDFTGAMGALVLFFLIFALAELFSPEGLRRRGVPVWFRNVFVAANTFAFYSLGAVVVGHFTFTAERLYLFQFSLGAALMLIGLGYKLWRADDPLYNIYFLKSLSFVTLSLATRFSGDALSACLAVETVALLISAWRSRLIVVRIFAFGVAGLAFVQSLNTAFLTAFGADLSALFDGARLILTTVPYDSPEYAAGAARALIGVAAFLSCSLLYQRIHWRLISPASAPFKPQTNLLLWQLDLVSEPPASESEAKKTLNPDISP